MELDEFDHRILEILKVDCRQTGEQISARIGLSPAASLRRVQRLRQIGAIEREVAIVAPEVDGLSVTILAFIQLKRGRADRIDALRKAFVRMPEVQHIYHITGDADLVLVLRCASMEAYAAFTEAQFYSDQIAGFDTKVVLRDYSPKLA